MRCPYCKAELSGELEETPLHMAKQALWYLHALRQEVERGGSRQLSATASALIHWVDELVAMVKESLTH